MDCIKTICLFLKNYISEEQFITVFYEYINDFQNFLAEDIYLNILSTNFSSKEEKISLETELRNFVLDNYQSLYEIINDAYVEHMLDLDEEDIVVEMLKKKYEKREEVDIDCSVINTQLELIVAIKNALHYPKFCGNNWNAVEDLIYDIVFPKRLVFLNWLEMKNKLPKDAEILSDILDSNNSRCVIIYN